LDAHTTAIICGYEKIADALHSIADALNRIAQSLNNPHQPESFD